MIFRPPLTAIQLREIWLRNQTEDMLSVLWECRRLRALVLRADQLQRLMPSRGGMEGTILELLRQELKGEPCVEESSGTGASNREAKRQARNRRNG